MPSVPPSDGLIPSEDGGGGESTLVLIAEFDIAGATTVDMESVFSSTFDSYMGFLSAIVPNGNEQPRFRFMNGSTAIETASYTYGSVYGGGVGPNDIEAGGDGEFIGVTNQSYRVGLPSAAAFWITRLNATQFTLLSVFGITNNFVALDFPGIINITYGYDNSAVAQDGLQFFGSGGNGFASGTATVYGIKS